MALFRSLAYPSFTFLWGGQTLSRTGDYLYQVALAWWVLEKTGSATMMGTVLIFSFTPMLLFLLLGGVAVDRLPRVKLMLVSDLVRGVVVALVAGLAFAGALEIWHVLLVSLIFGLVSAVFQPAYTALVPELLPREALSSANSLYSISSQIGRIGGPALGAALLGLGGTPIAFAVNALSFFLSAVCLTPLLGVTLPSRQRRGAQQAHIFHDVREGLATVMRSPVLWITILMYALANVTLVGPYSVGLPFLVKEHLHGDASLLSLLYAVFPAGYILGGVWLGRKAGIRRRGPTMYLGGMVAGLGLLTLGLPVPLIIVGLAALLNGAALESCNLAWVNVLQEEVPGELLGRVSSIDMLGSSILMPVGFALTGWAIDVLGPATVFVVGGGLTMMVALLGLAHPKIRKLD